MTATDELRRMLDERGVHWWAGEDERKTLWESNGLTWEYFNDENGDAWLGFLGACEQDITPEQAIAATLGDGTCHADKTETWQGVCISNPIKYVRNLTIRVMECSACGGTYEYVNGSYEYCPRCGRRVVE